MEEHSQWNSPAMIDWQGGISCFESLFSHSCLSVNTKGFTHQFAIPGCHSLE